MIGSIKNYFNYYKKKNVIIDFFFKKALTDENDFKLKLVNIKKYYDIEDSAHIEGILNIISKFKFSDNALIAGYNLIQLIRTIKDSDSIYKYIPIFKFIFNKIRYDYSNKYERIDLIESQYIYIFLSRLKVNKDTTNNNFDELISLCHFLMKEAYNDHHENDKTLNQYDDNISNLVFEKITNIIKIIDNNDIYKLKEIVNFINSYDSFYIYYESIIATNKKGLTCSMPLFLLEKLNKNNYEILLELDLSNFRDEYDDNGYLNNLFLNSSIKQFIEKCPDSSVSKYYNELILKAII